MEQDILFVLTFGIVSGVVLVSFYLPFYFPNQEAIFDVFGEEFHKGAINVTNRLIDSLQEDIEISKEQKEELQKEMTDLTHEDDEDNKKQ